nr:MAG TPA: LysM [Caudoviricetes sp.]
MENEINRMIQNTESGSYKVRRGDTLSRIARKYGISVKDLAELNNIKDVNKIRAGQTLRYNKRYIRPATRKSSKNTHKSGMKNPSNYRVVRNAYGQYAFM